MLSHVYAELRGDKEFVMKALENYHREEEDELEEVITAPDWFSSASREIRSDPEVIIDTVERNGLFLDDVILKEENGDAANVGIVERALEQDINALRYVPESFKSHPKIAAATIRISHGGFSNPDPGFFRRHLGEPLLQKIRSVWNQYELGQANSDQIELSEHRDVQAWLTKWKQALWHKIWILDQAGMTKDVQRAVLEFTDILPDFRLARKIAAAAPVVEALAAADVGVDEFLGVRTDWESEKNSDSEEDSDSV